MKRVGWSCWFVVVVFLVAACKDKEKEAEKPPSQDPVSASDQAEAARRQAEAEMARAVQEAKDAQAKVETLQRDAESLAQRVNVAVDALASAQSQADRDKAKTMLEQLRTEKAELEQRIAEAKAKAERAERLKGVKISKECIDNPLAKGCN